MRQDSVYIQPLGTASLTERLREQIILAITFGELEPGGRIVEEDLAEKFGVSRSPVRHVLHELASEGLLVREGPRKLHVAQISRRDLDEVYGCRIPLEGICAAAAAEQRTPRDIEALERAMEAQIAARASGQARDYFLWNVAFTGLIHDISGNATVRRILKSLSVQSQRYRYAAYRMIPSLMDLSVEGSREICSAIAEGKADTARSVTEELIHGSWQKIRTHFDD